MNSWDRRKLLNTLLALPAAASLPWIGMLQNDASTAECKYRCHYEPMITYISPEWTHAFETGDLSAAVTKEDAT